MNALVGRAWRGYADARRSLTRAGSAASTLDSLGRPSRREVEVWLRETADAHEAYRAAHPPPVASVAIMCVSTRPQFLSRVVDTVLAQQLVDVEFVFVANAPEFVLDDVARELERVANCRLDVPPTGTTLGAGLNRALATTDARFVAKMDDDDLYGPNYLVDSLRAHAASGGGVVGKHSYFARLDRQDRTVLRFPANDFRYSSTLAGGTLVIDRDLVDDQGFADTSIGEDRDFIARCHRRGISTYSADRFNYVHVRGTDNTWIISDDRFEEAAMPADAATVFR